MKSDLLVFGEEAKHLYEESYGSQGTVTASSLRVRKEPSMDAGQIGSMKQGSRVEILGQEGDWYQVSCGEDSAYMFAEYIQIEETTALSVAEYETQQKEKNRLCSRLARQEHPCLHLTVNWRFWQQLFSVRQGRKPHRKSCRRSGYHEPGKKQSVSEQHYRSCLPEWAVFSGSQRNPFFCIEPGSKK